LVFGFPRSKAKGQRPFSFHQLRNHNRRRKCFTHRALV